ncbi:hypothetical protein Y032_0067g116 [Ancylostoma ceylanicum]|nr:hypothetical protein Y032_0067g116 [Ancylostoma ceylanicum]
MGFKRWGTGFCCCRSEKCNRLPPEWVTEMSHCTEIRVKSYLYRFQLALSLWHFRWRVFSNFMIMVTFFSIVYFIYGIFEARNLEIQEVKKKRKRQSERVHRHDD